MIPEASIRKHCTDNTLIIILLNEKHVQDYDFPIYQKCVTPNDFNANEYLGFSDMDVYENGIDYYPNRRVVILTEIEE